MITLAFDTAAKTASVALLRNGAPLAEYSIESGLTQSELILPMAENMLKLSGLSFSDVGLLAVSAGPGSFTGVRIGVSTVKGLAFGRNVPCIGVSATEALAYNYLNIDCIVCPSMDARRSQLYNALYRSRNGKIERLTDDRSISSTDLAKELEAYKEPIYLCGGGEHIIKSAAEGNPYVKATPEILKNQNGYSVALCAYRLYKDGKGTGTDKELAPSYLRPSQAERIRQGLE